MRPRLEGYMLSPMSVPTERITSHFAANLTAAFSLSNERLFALALVLSVVPIWLSPHLPMVDMPQHAAQIVAMKEIWAGNETFTQLYQINWFTPYLLGYLLLYVVSLVVPVAVATQILVSIAVVSVSWLTGALLRAAGADARWKWVAIPGSYGFAFYWGFLSFIVATPVALLFLIQAIRFARQPTLRNALATAAFSVFLFFCHVIVLCFVSLAALGYLVGCNYRNIRQLAIRSLPFAAPLPLIAIWLVATYTTEISASSTPMAYGGPFLGRLYQLLLQPTGRDVFSPFFTVPAAAAVVLLPVLAGSRFSPRPERWLPFAVGLLVFFIIPGYIMNAGFIAYRLGIFLTPLWLMAWDAPSEGSARPSEQNLEWLALPIVLLWVVFNVGRFSAFAGDSRSFDTLMAAAEPNRRVAAMVEENTTRWFSTPVYMHHVAWYTSTHRGIVDFNFADFYSQTVRYKPDVGPRISEPLAWAPRDFDWERDGGAVYDYFVVKSGLDISAAIFKQKRPAVELVQHVGSWWLYRNKERAVHLPGTGAAVEATPLSR